MLGKVVFKVGWLYDAYLLIDFVDELHEMISDNCIDIIELFEELQVIQLGHLNGVKVGFEYVQILVSGQVKRRQIGFKHVSHEVRTWGSLQFPAFGFQLLDLTLT